MKDFVLSKLDEFDDPLFRFDPKWHKYTYDYESDGVELTS